MGELDLGLLLELLTKLAPDVLNLHEEEQDMVMDGGWWMGYGHFTAATKIFVGCFWVWVMEKIEGSFFWMILFFFPLLVFACFCQKVDGIQSRIINANDK